MVSLNGRVLHIPAFTKGKAQLSKTEVRQTREIANVRIHIERVIGNVRQKYSILQVTLPLDSLQGSSGEPPLLTCIVCVGCALSDLSESVVPFE